MWYHCRYYDLAISTFLFAVFTLMKYPQISTLLKHEPIKPPNLITLTSQINACIAEIKSSYSLQTPPLTHLQKQYTSTLSFIQYLEKLLDEYYGVIDMYYGIEECDLEPKYNEWCKWCEDIKEKSRREYIRIVRGIESGEIKDIPPVGEVKSISPISPTSPQKTLTPMESRKELLSPTSPNTLTNRTSKKTLVNQSASLTNSLKETTDLLRQELERNASIGQGVGMFFLDCNLI